MKLTLKIESVFLIFALLTSCVAATENKDLPTKEEITDFIAGIPVSDNYIITVFDAVKEKQPAWNCDIWEDKNGNQILSLYYVDPDSTKGYGSIYFNELGKEISMRGVEADLVNHYVGEAVSEEQPADEEAQPVEEKVQSIGDERQAKYEKQLAETENKDLPTKKEITDFIAGIPVSDNYIITVFNAVKDKKPAWNCDTWVDKNGNQILSLYYVDPDSAKGYGSIYFNELGKEISMLGVEARLVNHYVGEAVSEEQPAEEETQPVEEETQPIKKAEQPAETENKDLPTKEEITYFIAGIPVSNNYINTVFNAVKDKHPAWNCDTWVDKNGNQIISLYYVDPYSSKGYDSIYFNELGKEVSMLGVEPSLVNHYVGEAVSEEQLG